MTVQTTKTVRIAFAKEESYGKLCQIVGNIAQGAITYTAHTFTVKYFENGSEATKTVTLSGINAVVADVVTMLNAAFVTAGCQEFITASNTGNYIIFTLKSGCKLTDGTDTPLVTHLGIPAGYYPLRVFCSNNIITTVDISGGALISGKTLTIDNTTVTFDSDPGTQGAMVIELNDAFIAAGVDGKIVASASGTNFINLAYTENIAINAVAATTSLVLLGITAGFYGYWTSINVPSSVKIGLNEKERERLHTSGFSGNTNFVRVKGIRQKDMELKTWIQNYKWMTEAIETDTGSTPKSYTFHSEIPADNGAMAYSDTVGCVINKYEMALERDDCFETTTWMWLDSVDLGNAAGAYTSIPTYPITTALKDYSTGYVSIDGDSLASVLETATLTITNELFDFKGAGSYLRSTPQQLSRDVELKIESMDDIANQFVLLDTQSPTSIIAICGFGALYRVKITNMLIDDSNKGEIGEKLEAQKHSMTFKNAGASVYSIE